MSRVPAGQTLMEVGTLPNSADAIMPDSAFAPSTIMAPPKNGTSTSAFTTLNRISLNDLWRKGIAALRARWHLRQARSVGPRTRVWGRPSIQISGEMIVGEGVQFVSTIAKLEIAVGANAMLDIGDDTFINYGTSISANRCVRIGAGSLLGMHVLIMDNDFHRLDPTRRHELPESAPIILEENVWLAARVIVLPGVTIGANSVIGAGSVVTKNIPPNVFAAGVPAKVIKNL